MTLTHEDLQEMVRLLDASDFDELQLETGRVKLTLKRSATGGWTQETQTLGQPRLFSRTEQPGADVPPSGVPAPGSSRAKAPPAAPTTRVTDEPGASNPS